MQNILTKRFQIENYFTIIYRLDKKLRKIILLVIIRCHKIFGNFFFLHEIQEMRPLSCSIKKIKIFIFQIVFNRKQIHQFQSLQTHYHFAKQRATIKRSLPVSALTSPTYATAPLPIFPNAAIVELGLAADGANTIDCVLAFSTGL